MHRNNSTQLNDKPKFVYINTCQIKPNKNNVAKDTDACPTNKNTCQSEPQVKEDAECSKGGETNSEKEDVKQYFNVPDLYVTFATVPESKAFRTEESGSVFIKSLLTVYERNKEKCDISSLSPDINAQVSKESKKISIEQTSSFYSTLKKKVTLRATD
uniref:Caspase family p10 domain-containing protein n=1 Tax=Octopus bimaculoides TaxID=37653 RepID=A0A0L8G2W7_OCTBM